MTKKVVHIITGLNDGGAEGVLTRLCLHSEQVQHVVISLMDEGKYGPLLARSSVKVHCLGMNPGKPSIVRLFRLLFWVSRALSGSSLSVFPLSSEVPQRPSSLAPEAP